MRIYSQMGFNLLMFNKPMNYMPPQKTYWKLRLSLTIGWKKCICCQPNDMIFLEFVGKTYTKFVIKYHQNLLTIEGFMEVFLDMQKSLFEKVGEGLQSAFFQMHFLLIKILEFRKVVKTKVGEKCLKFSNMKSDFSQLGQGRR